MNYCLGNNYKVAFAGALFIAQISTLFHDSFSSDFHLILNHGSAEVTYELLEEFSSFNPRNGASNTRYIVQSSKPLYVPLYDLPKINDGIMPCKDKKIGMYACVWCIDQMVRASKQNKLSFASIWHFFYKSSQTRQGHIYDVHGGDKVDGQVASNTKCHCNNKTRLASSFELINRNKVNYNTYMKHFFTKHFDRENLDRYIENTFTIPLPSQKDLNFLKQNSALYHLYWDNLYYSIPFSILQEEGFSADNLYSRIHMIRDYLQSKIDARKKHDVTTEVRRDIQAIETFE